MAKVFAIDVSKCNGCYGCQIVCKDEHCGNDWHPYAAAQPDIGHFWMKIDERTRGQVPVVKVSYIPVLCAHCEDAPCAKVCPSDAFSRRDDGLLLIDPAKCTGCGACVPACPQGSIFMNEQSNIAQKCTGCAHLLDNGWSVPRCVDVCSHDAILYGEESELADSLKGAEFYPAVDGLQPKVYYRNLPKRFIAGAVVDLEADELIIGATVSIKGEDGYAATVATDDFGDFIFEQIAAQPYTVTISAEGYAPTSMHADVTSKDLTLGDIEVKKA